MPKDKTARLIYVVGGLALVHGVVGLSISITYLLKAMSEDRAVYLSGAPKILDSIGILVLASVFTVALVGSVQLLRGRDVGRKILSGAAIAMLALSVLSLPFGPRYMTVILPIIYLVVLYRAGTRQPLTETRPEQSAGAAEPAQP